MNNIKQAKGSDDPYVRELATALDRERLYTIPYFHTYIKPTLSHHAVNIANHHQKAVESFITKRNKADYLLKKANGEGLITDPKWIGVKE